MQRSHNDFNPRAPYGARPLLRPAQAHAPWHFNPRAPYGARLASLGHGAWIYTDFNPRAPYGARHDLLNQPYKTGDISIHAPHMGRDKRGVGCGLRAVIFQSTRPIWGATAMSRGIMTCKRNFNPRAPYGARRGVLLHLVRCSLISIHAPHMGRDVLHCTYWRKDTDISIHAPHMGRDCNSYTYSRLSS